MALEARNPLQTLTTELYAPKALKEINKALPKDIDPQRFVRTVLTAVQKEPKLLECTRASFNQSMMYAAEDGLYPDGTEGVLIPFGNLVAWLPMVTGYFKRAYNSGLISTWEAHAVYQADRFRFHLGSDPRLEHEPELFRGDRGELIAAYSRVLMRDGAVVFEVMGRADIEKRRAMSKTWKKEDSPWNKWFEEMARKTVVKHHGKSLPLSADFRAMLARDDERNGFGFEGQRRLTYQPSTLAGQLDDLVASAREEQEVQPPPPRARRGLYPEAQEAARGGRATLRAFMEGITPIEREKVIEKFGESLWNEAKEVDRKRAEQAEQADEE